MRKTCRWLGCAALLCFTAVELSGCTSKPLISGFKLPGSKDKDATVAQKGQKLTAKESEDLLAQARKLEKAGDYTSASRVYREYLNGGGEPTEAKRSTATQQVSKTTTKPASKTAAISPSDTDKTPPERQTAKAKPPLPTPQKPTRKTSVATDDPWADVPIGQSDSAAVADIPTDSKSTPSAKLASKQTEIPSPPDKATPPSKSHEWAELDFANVPASDAPSLASERRQPPPEDASDESHDNLIDLDEGELSWEETPVEPQNAAVEEPFSEVVETPEAVPDSELPLINLSEDAGDPPSTPAFEEEFAPETEVPEAAVTEAEAPNGNWESHELGAEPTDDLALTDMVDMSLPSEEEFAPPVLSDTDEYPDTTAIDHAELLSLTCKDSEPWLYAQVMKLGSANAQLRKEGLTHLADMGSTAREAGLAVRILLADPDPLVQAHAAWALWVIENDPWDSVATLRPLLDHSNPDVVELACYMLGDIGSQADSARDALTLLRDHADGTLQIHAAESLIRIQGVDDKSLAVLTTALNSRVSQERWIAAVALGRCRGEKSAGAVTALMTALKDVDPEIRSAAALSLGGLGPEAEKAMPELERMARTDDVQVRDSARAAMACLRR
jgi:HEAT repeats